MLIATFVERLLVYSFGQLLIARRGTCAVPYCLVSWPRRDTGFVVSEKIETDPKTCAIKNPSLSKYIIGTSMDVPEVYPIVVSSEGEAGPFGAKGIGEPALIPSIPATMAAIGNALGVKFHHTPVLAADIVKAWKDKQAAEAAAN